MSEKETGRMPDDPNESTAGVSRRSFLSGTGALVVVGSLGIRPPPLSARDSPDSRQDPVPSTPITVTVNGIRHDLEVEDRWTLNEMLRDAIGLKGSKIGCNRGECGACSVLLDGVVVYSCSTLAVWADRASITTVEGLEQEGVPSAIQRAFMDHNGAQCGFCTPGQVVAATALLSSNPDPTRDEIRRALAGNLCRCSNYNAIVEAVESAAEAMRSGGSA